VHDRTEQPRCPGVHVLDGIDAVAVEIRESHPVLIDLTLVRKRSGKLVLINWTLAVMNVL
jgi:hypothetical protein